MKVLALDEVACAGSPPVSVPDRELEMLAVLDEVEENIQDFHCVCLYPSCFLLKSLSSEILDLLSVVVSATSPVLCICLLVFMSLYFSFYFVLLASCVTVCLFFRPPVLAA